MNKILIIIPISVIAFVVVLLVSQMYEDKQALTFSKESCESFNGVWKEQEFECWGIELEECTRMGRTFEIREVNLYLGSSTICK